ncbi:asparaginase [Candidatus Fermentibacteria bacterium]|nr:asparaginase [Candidatus Fermentibacteria bacterium]
MKRTLRRILLVSTGGTIEMSPGPGGFAITGDAAIDADTAMIPPGIELCHRRLFSLPSPHMTPARMADLARELAMMETSGEWDGVVVTHGTDTLEESAYLADIHLRGGIPVAFTAAMRSNAELGVDGPRNVRGAVLTAASDEFHDFGVVVVLNDEIHCASRVTKTYTSNVSSFASPGYGPLGFIDGDKAIFAQAPLRRLRLPAGGLVLDERVGLVRVAAGLGAREIRFCVDSGDRAVVLEALGRGNVPPDVAEAVSEAVDSGVTVAVTTRCFMGRVMGLYGYPGGGADLERRGAVFAADLQGHKLRLLLMACLGAGMEEAEIRRLLECV